MSQTAAYYEDLATGLAIPSKAVIDGRLVHAKSGQSFENVNPATESTIGAVTSCDAADVDQAVVAARKSFESGVWSRAGVAKRKNVLLKLAGLVRTHSEQLAVLESLDTGKPITATKSATRFLNVFNGTPNCSIKVMARSHLQKMMSWPLSLKNQSVWSG
nr:aldehyde dehydrogenase family protein [Mesorhizobium sp.]